MTRHPSDQRPDEGPVAPSRAGDGRRLILLVLTTALLLNFPLLIVADRFARCCLPGFLPLYLFGAWALVILAGWRLGRGRLRA